MVPSQQTTTQGTTYRKSLRVQQGLSAVALVGFMHIAKRNKHACFALARIATNWGRGFFYVDGNKMGLSKTEQPDCRDLWVFTSGGAVSASDLAAILVDEIL